MTINEILNAAGVGFVTGAFHFTIRPVPVNVPDVAAQMVREIVHRALIVQHRRSDRHFLPDFNSIGADRQGGDTWRIICDYHRLWVLNHDGRRLHRQWRQLRTGAADGQQQRHKRCG